MDRTRRSRGRPATTPGHHADIRVALQLLVRAGCFLRLIADRAYDADQLRSTLRAAGAESVISGRRNRTVPIRHDRRRYRKPGRIEPAICRLKDFRRVATRYDELARTFPDAVTISAVYAFWL